VRLAEGLAALAARLLLSAAALLALAAPGPGILEFLGLAARAMQGESVALAPLEEARFVDRLATRGEGNVLLRFEGFGAGDPRLEYIYYRAVYSLWPRRALLGPAAGVVIDAAGIARAGSVQADPGWIEASGISQVALFSAAADGTVRLSYQDLAESP
jgi:hypothetical protein